MNTKLFATLALALILPLLVSAQTVVSPKEAAQNSQNPVPAGLGFGSHLKFTVETYIMDDYAKAAYASNHPPAFTLADLSAKLMTFEGTAARYKDWLKAMDAVVASLFATANPKLKTEKIDAAFRPFEVALKQEINAVNDLIRAYGGGPPSRPVNPVLIASWEQLPVAFDNANIVYKALQVESVLKQLQGASVALMTKVNEASSSLQNLGLESAVLTNAESILISLKQDQRSLSAEKRAAQISAPLEASQTAASDAKTQLANAGGDGLVRTHVVYQDLSDPFLSYIANSNNAWRAIPNAGSVSGDGDTQFILVFENHLDGRFRFVSVDPTKVIQARLRIGRKVTQSLVALSGVAASAFGVPIPTGLLTGTSEDSKGQDTVEFSKMTALEQQYRLQSDIESRQLEALRAFAIRELNGLSKENADDVRKNLIRQLQMMLPEQK